MATVMHRGHTIHDAMSAKMYCLRGAFSPGTKVTSPPTTRRSKSSCGSSMSAMVSAPKHGNTPSNGAKISRSVNEHSNSVSDTGTESESCAALTPNTTSGSPAQNTRRSISTLPSPVVSYTLTPSNDAGMLPKENRSNERVVRKEGRVALRIGSSAATITLLVAWSRYGQAAARTLFSHPARSTSLNASHAGSSPTSSCISDSSRVARSANACLDAVISFPFDFLLCCQPMKKPEATAPPPKPSTAAPSSPNRGLTKATTAAATCSGRLGPSLAARISSPMPPSVVVVVDDGASAAGSGASSMVRKRKASPASLISARSLSPASPGP